MPDVKIEPWMREAAKEIDSRNDWTWNGIAKIIATAYAAHEQGVELSAGHGSATIRFDDPKGTL